MKGLLFGAGCGVAAAIPAFTASTANDTRKPMKL